MKQLNLIRNLFSVAVMITLACNVSAQVSIRDRIQIMDRDIFNYPELTETLFSSVADALLFEDNRPFRSGFYFYRQK